MEIGKVTNLIAENIDELADLSELWLNNREGGRTSSALQIAIIHLCKEITTQVQLHDAALLTSKTDSEAALTSDQIRKKLKSVNTFYEVEREALNTHIEGPVVDKMLANSMKKVK